jgi:hypothetical protein
LVKCRKALEETTSYVKKLGFKKKELNDKGQPTGKIIPDWERFFKDKDKGDIIGKILQKAYGFTGPGSHTGSILNSNHAYFILLQTFSLIQIVISRLTLSLDTKNERSR